MCKILLFAGTTEGYALAEYLYENQVAAHICTATDYGQKGLQERENFTCSGQRMDRGEIEAFLEEGEFTHVVDATHPYAAQASVNIREACRAKHVPYMRVLREGLPVRDAQGAPQEGLSVQEGRNASQSGARPGGVRETDAKSLGDACRVHYVESIAAAVDFLKGTEGNILVSTGSKELAAFTQLPDYENRVYARVLSLPSVVESCAGLGFTGSHLICMQGPFSLEMNEAMLRQWDCKYLVTKDTGHAGGFQEKCEAAFRQGASLVIIGRPVREQGDTFWECKRKLQSICQIPYRPQVSLVGIGMGGGGTMTLAGQEACKEAELLVGAGRMVEAAASPGQQILREYRADEILNYLLGHPQYEKIAVALSGDVGFYSGCRRLMEKLRDGLPPDAIVQAIPGISSLNYFMAKIGRGWERAALASAHGRTCNLVHLIKSHEGTFGILGDAGGIAALAQKLCTYGMGEVRLFVGEQLSYPQEKIFSAHAEELTDYQGDALSVFYAENPCPVVYPGRIRDEAFIRNAPGEKTVPMTKEEVRAVSLAKLEITEDAVCYDVGAGTGSLSVEMAMRAFGGKVYAVERKPEAVELIRENACRLGADNLEVVEGTAPEALGALEAPTHCFIGGSSGNLREILEVILGKNPAARIVINCITLETLQEAMDSMEALALGGTEVVQVAVSRARKLGRYHMMMGENPIYIISCTGGKTQ